MRAADLARLNELYPEALEPTEEDVRAAIGIKLPTPTEPIFQGSLRLG